MQTYRYVICDVFTEHKLKGNPLAVFTDARGMSDERQQAFARELNLSETTFVFPAEKGGHAKVRIFTPRTELPFAGHPVLGTALVLANGIEVEVIQLELKHGPIPVRILREGPRAMFGWMLQPVPTWAPYAESGELLKVLGLTQSELPVELYDNGAQHLLVHVASSELVARLTPNLHELERLTQATVSVFSITDLSAKTRVFAPASGVPEDPATGSAAGPLAVHLARYGKWPFGDVLRIEQGAEIQRSSELFAKVSGQGQRIEQVEVGGGVQIVARGEFRV